MNNHVFQKIIDYKFNDINLLKIAFTHSSYARSNQNEYTDCNERLEFLGDAFFDAIISEALYKKMRGQNEGVLTKTRAMIVCEKSLALVGKELGIGEYIIMSKGEEAAGGRERCSIIADTMEAVIGAIYIDGGFSKAKEIVLNIFEKRIEEGINGDLFVDYKTRAQEVLQVKGKLTSIKYVIDKEEGPPHNKKFYVYLVCDGEILGYGSGKTKKEAEQNASKETLSMLERRK